jgi:hypothetical protein
MDTTARVELPDRIAEADPAESHWAVDAVRYSLKYGPLSEEPPSTTREDRDHASQPRPEE